MNLNIIEDELAVLLDVKFAFIIVQWQINGRIKIVNTIFAETKDENNNDLIADIGPYQINRRQNLGFTLISFFERRNIFDLIYDINIIYCYISFKSFSFFIFSIFFMFKTFL